LSEIYHFDAGFFITLKIPFSNKNVIRINVENIKNVFSVQKRIFLCQISSRCAVQINANEFSARGNKKKEKQ
jgi:hypothetical protein